MTPEQAHSRFVSGELTYDDDVREEIARALEDVATYASRGEVVEAVNAAYAVTGRHEDWLQANALQRTERRADA